jgi:hypothetical protein
MTVLTRGDLLKTAASIAALQLPSGMIEWFPGGHCDPWNHVETAMALDVMGLHDESRLAYRWLAEIQRADGSFFNYYRVDAPGGVEDAKLDTNVCAYVAAGVWHHFLCTADVAFVREVWPMVQRAIDWVLTLQTPRGEIIWACHTDGRPWTYALLTGSSSIHHAIRCACSVAELIGEDATAWELAAVNLAHVITTQPDTAFAPKRRWAMDWYYPVLGGVLHGDDAIARMRSRFDEFVMPGLGVRCVSNEPWVTAAETCECAIAHVAIGAHDIAEDLVACTLRHRDADGSYFTGIVHPDEIVFPAGERTAYTAAAVILAADALDGLTPASTLFTHPWW